MIYGKFGPTSYQVWCVDYIGGWLSRVFGQAQGASSCEGMLKERCFHGLGKLCWFVKFVFPFPLFPESFFFARCILNRIGILANSNALHGFVLGHGSFKHRWLAFSGGALEVELSLVRVLKRQSAWWDFWGTPDAGGGNCQYGRLQHVWCEGSSVFHFQLHVLRLGCIFIWKKLYHVI